ncbi:hypothetical protein M378DRAFT_180440 [Amanita muscaria Koide BX008]|uniref:Uncharacterized protein n=1 Tax=Amanita muscaria (strain Koide BX008) TaxID=946122 RepID=A0A0C2SBZ0_AMAMK|nr:hypothetical protein M378DRAFT_180440 [Amanita muscaria Koide BX008]
MSRSSRHSKRTQFLLSEDFQDLAQDLERYGLKRQRRLDLSLFIAKPLIRCSELDLLKFIPRVDSQRPDYDNINTLLAPSQITTPEFEASAGVGKGRQIHRLTQLYAARIKRLAGLTDSTERMCIAGTSSNTRGDSAKTWPPEGITFGSPGHRDLTEILFLNVDDPESNDWTWHSASNLVIDLLDIGDMHGVKGFLRNYNELLKGAGVKNEQLKQYRLQTRRCIICAIASKICASLGTKVSWWPAIIITSGMKASPTLESDEPIRVEHSRMCVREAIDWFYVGKLSDLLISNSNNEEETKRRLELGLDMLSLADKWEVTDLHEQLQVFIINDQDFLNSYWV